MTRNLGIYIFIRNGNKLKFRNLLTNQYVKFTPTDTFKQYKDIISISCSLGFQKFLLITSNIYKKLHGHQNFTTHISNLNRITEIIYFYKCLYKLLPSRALSLCLSERFVRLSSRNQKLSPAFFGHLFIFHFY